VLAIDDEPHILRTIERMLGGDHDVVSARGGREALELLGRGERFDAIFCDLIMPEVTGMDLHAELLRTAPEIAAGIVFMTGAVFASQAKRFLASVPNRRIIKPLANDALRSILRDVVSGGPVVARRA